MGIKSYRDLEVWQKAMDMVVDCYQVAGKVPRNELYGLAGQLQRASVSVPSNIAEGRARQHTKELLHYLSMAYGSLAEVETLMQIAERLGYIDSSEVCRILDQTAEIGRMINGLCRSIRKRF